jgi:hypothetical protein
VVAVSLPRPVHTMHLPGAENVHMQMEQYSGETLNSHLSE